MSGYSVDRGKWESKDIFYQMGNISSEVGRSIAAKRQGRDADSQKAVQRAVDLLDATIEASTRQKPARAKEIKLAKEQFLLVIGGDGQGADDMAGLERYFTQYAVAARRSR